MKLQQANPFQHSGFWYWTDESAVSHGPYHSQMDALRSLMKHIDPPWFVNLWVTIKRFWHDQRG